MPQAATSTGAARGGPLDALRFLAALFIVIYHYAEDAPVSLGQAMSWAWVATDFFLLLSGYVLARAYGSKVSAGALDAPRFLWRRVLRIWPAHIVMLLVLVAIVEAARLSGATEHHSRMYELSTLPAHIGLVQAWGLGAEPSWNLPTWSLSALIVCYAAFPFAWRMLGRMAPSHALLAGLAALWVGVSVAALGGHRLADLPMEVGVLRALPLFLFGAALARLDPRDLTRSGPAHPFAAAVAAPAAFGLVAVEPGLAAVLALGLIVVVAGAWRGQGSRLAERAARLSFALFITHFVTGEVFFRLLQRLSGGGDTHLDGAVGWAVWLGGIVTAVAVAWAFDRLIDRPVQRWIAARRARGGSTETAGLAPAP